MVCTAAADQVLELTEENVELVLDEVGWVGRRRRGEPSWGAAGAVGLRAAARWRARREPQAQRLPPVLPARCVPSAGGWLLGCRTWGLSVAWACCCLP